MIVSNVGLATNMTPRSMQLPAASVQKHHSTSDQIQLKVGTLVAPLFTLGADLGVIFDTDVDRSGVVDGARSRTRSYA